MPLNGQQKALIEGAIGFLVDDLPKESKEFIATVNTLKKAFSFELNRKNEKGEDEIFFTLQECIATPKEHFGKLVSDVDEEETSFGQMTYFGIEPGLEPEIKPIATPPKIKIGEVVSYILDFVSQKIQDGAKDIPELKLETLAWNPEALLIKLKILMGREFHETYRQEFAPSSGSRSRSESLPAPEPRLYTYELNSETLLMENDSAFSVFAIDLKIKLSADNIIKRRIPFEETMEAVSSDEKESQLNNLEPRAAVLAEKAASEIIINHLIEEKIITAEEEKMMAPLARELITYPYCYNLVKNKSCPIEEIQRLTADEVDILTSTNMISLLETGRIPLQTAKKLNKFVIKLFEHPVYHRKVLEGAIKIDELAAIKTDNHVKTLIFSKFLKLLEAEIINVADILAATPNCKILLERDDDFYFNLVKKRALDFGSIQKITEDQRKILLSEQLISMIGKDVVTPKAVIALTGNRLIVHLIKEQLLTISDFEKILPFDADFIPSVNIPAQYNKFFFRVILNDFMKFAQAGFLFLEDLTYLFEHQKEFHSMPAPSDAMEEKKGDFTQLPPLLRDKHLLNICRTNIKIRLDAVRSGKPLILHSGQPDKLSNILYYLQKLDLDFSDISSSIFGLRLLRIYQDLPADLSSGKDSFIQIKTDINNMLGYHYYSKPQIHNKIMKHLIEGIVEDMNKDSDLLTSKLGPIYEKIYSIYDRTRSEEHKSLHGEPWSEAFANIVNLAREEEKSIDLFKLPKTTTFTLFSKKCAIKDFCLSLIQFAHELNNFEPIEQVSRMREASSSESARVSNRKRSFSVMMG